MQNLSEEKSKATPEAELSAYWHLFCDADYFDGCHDFPDRMEAAGLAELVPVTDEDLHETFASERGIEPGGMMWRLTDAGRAVIARVEGR